MKITELKQLILKSNKTLQQPKYIILTNEDYLSLKEEIQEIYTFLDIKNGKDDMKFNNIMIISESEMLDLRISHCNHLNKYTTMTDFQGVVTNCVDCGQGLE